MGRINLLSFELANLIAAGEVVDRPSSAVKELLENAIDSGADNITVEIQRGGVSFIRIEDNGCGIDRDDMPTAIMRHSTSKIKNVEDLDSIMTLGFRGEALAAIASVSRLRIFSRTAYSQTGALLTADGGRIESLIDISCPVGTTVIVEELFHNVPARRKFLKKDSTESTAIGAVVEKIALSRPDISMKYISDGDVKFRTSGNGDLLQTIWALFGREASQRSLRVEREENGIKISGYVSEPDMHRSTRNMENFFINGRYIKSKTAAAALEQAYSSKMPSEKFPFCVLNIEIPPQSVDVNVHPAKLEVKFSNEKLIYDAVYYAVLSALDAEAKRPELQLASDKGNAARTKNAPIGAEELYGAFRALDQKPKKADQIRLSDIVPEVKNIKEAAEKKNLPGQRSYADDFIPLSGEAEDTHEELVRVNREARENLERARDFKPSYITVDELEAEERERNAADGQTAPTELTAPREQKPAELPQTEKAPLSYDELGEIDPSEIPEYVIIGEAFNCYVLVQIGDRLLMIDKHAAHERILFDELSRKMRANLLSPDRQLGGQLLFAPLELSLLATEAEALGEYSDRIKALGFDYTSDQRSISSYLVKIVQIPESLSPEASLELFTSLISTLSDAGAGVEAAAESFFETRLWQAACKAAIKGGRIYDIAHIKWICDRLLKKPSEDNQVIRTCPHGRPVAFEIKKSAIDRQFARLT